MESNSKQKVLIIDPDRENAANIRLHLEELLSDEIEVIVAHDIDEGLAASREDAYTSIFVGENLSGGRGARNSFDLIAQLFNEKPDSYIVGFFSSDESLVKLSKVGCHHTVRMAKSPDYHTNILHMVLDAGKPDKHYSASW